MLIKENALAMLDEQIGRLESIIDYWIQCNENNKEDLAIARKKLMAAKKNKIMIDANLHAGHPDKEVLLELAEELIAKYSDIVDTEESIAGREGAQLAEFRAEREQYIEIRKLVEADER